MSESIQEMESRWAVQMAVRYGAGHPRSGERIHDVDLQHQRECMALRVQIEDRKKAEASRPQINQSQLDWLNQVQAAADKDGKRPAQEISQKGTVIRKNLEKARIQVLSGKPLSAEVIAATEAEFAKQGVTMPAITPRPVGTYRDRDGNILGDVRAMPPALDLAPALPQPMITVITGRGRQA